MRWHMTVAAIAMFLGVGAATAQSKPGLHPRHTLGGTLWVLAEVHGESPENDTPQASIQFDEKTGRISGTGGCNRLIGTFETKEPATAAQALHFKGVGSTMMACGAETMKQEKSLIDALNATGAYRIRGTTLSVLDQPGKGAKILARFEAEEPPAQQQ